MTEETVGTQDGGEGTVAALEALLKQPAFAEATAGGPASAPPPDPRALAAQGKAQADLVRARNEPAIAQQQALLEMMGKLLAAKIQAGADVESARIRAGADLARPLADSLREIFMVAQPTDRPVASEPMPQPGANPR